MTGLKEKNTQKPMKKIPKTIIVTGTPATGKTTTAKKVARRLGLTYVDVNKVIAEHNLSEGFDEERDCKIIDEKKLAKTLIGLIKASETGLVIDSHMSQCIPKEHVRLAMITKCELKELKTRLEKRGYSETKVKENMDSEIFDVCKVEAEEAGHTCIIINTSAGSTDLEDALEDMEYFENFTA